MSVMICYFQNDTKVTLGDDMLAAFKSIGHEAVLFDTTVQRKYSFLWKILKSLAKLIGARKYVVDLQSRYLNRQLAGRFAKAAMAVRPNLIVVIAGQRIDPHQLQATAARLGARTALWWVEGPLRENTLLEELEYYDAVFSISHEYAAHGIQHLPSWAVNSQQYSPIDFSDKRRRLLFVGDHSTYREELLTSLSDMPLRIVGNWDRYLRPDHPLRKCDLQLPVHISQLADEYRRALAVIDIPKMPQTQQQGVNLRFADVPACGTVLLTTDTDEARRWFRDGENILTYVDASSLRTQCQRILDSDALCKQLAEAAAIAARALPTYTDRARSIVQVLKDD